MFWSLRQETRKSQDHSELLLLDTRPGQGIDFSSLRVRGGNSPGRNGITDPNHARFPLEKTELPPLRSPRWF